MTAMSTAKPKVEASPKVAPPQEQRPDLVRGLRGTAQERAEKRKEFAKKHRETLRRLGE